MAVCKQDMFDVSEILVDGLQRFLQPAYIFHKPAINQHQTFFICDEKKVNEDAADLENEKIIHLNYY